MNKLILPFIQQIDENNEAIDIFKTEHPGGFLKVLWCDRFKWDSRMATAHIDLDILIAAIESSNAAIKEKLKTEFGVLIP